jgi:hypothetical protein
MKWDMFVPSADVNSLNKNIITRKEDVGCLLDGTIDIDVVGSIDPWIMEQ